ncbi:MAG: DUF11 domain-containing protein, partial [Gemmataceae bacterium]|nr:DUF11 domain-containing protein [Gemmataceae bacterium]
MSLSSFGLKRLPAIFARLQKRRPRTRRWWSGWRLEFLERRDVPSTVITPFTARFSRNEPGDIAIIGNTLLTAPAGAAGDAARNGTGANLNNNDFNMVNVDVDSDTSTFNSSRATLTMPAGATVLFAGLYWGADSSNAARNQVRFQTPSTGSYVTLTGAVVGATGGDYSAFVDVTPYVQIGGNGVYTVANVQATVGSTDRQGGWGLVVAYRDPAAPPRNLTIFDGFVVVNTTNPSSISTPISGFTTPLSGPVNAKVGFITYEGDLGFTGDFCQLNGTTLTDAQNPSTNFFNSTVSNLGIPSTGRTPSYVNQMGFDADIINVPGVIPNAATSATVTVGTTNEVYYPSVITTAIDIYAPTLTSPKTVVDLNGGAINPGDILEYTVTVQNNGGDNGTLSVLTDPIPTYTSYVPGSLRIVSGANAGVKTDGTGADQAEFDAVNNRVIFRIGTGANATTGGLLAIGVPTSISFRVQVGAATPNNAVILNQATVSTKGATAGLVVSSASAAASSTVVANAAGLRIEKSVNNSRPNVGDTISFTLSVTNNGPAGTTGVVVNDPMPTGLTFVSATGTGSYNSGTGAWTIGNLANGAVATITINALVAGPNASTNVATIASSSAPDPDPTDNTASTPVTPQRSDLGIFKSIDDNTPNVGQIVTYAILVTNYGPDPATGIQVTDLLPAGTTFVSATTLSGTYNQTTGVWTVGNLSEAGTAYLTVRARVTSATPANNIATITAAAQYDPNPGNNSSTATLTPQMADLSLVKTVNNATPVANETITFTLTVTNSGPATATNARVTDLLPPGMAYVGSTPSAGTYDSATNIWTVGSIPSGASRTLTLQVRVTDPNPSINRASASSDQYDPDPGDNLASTNVTPQIADIDVDKQVSTFGPNVGDTIAYSVQVSNRGPNSATGVFVNDLLPSGVTFASSVASQGSYNSATGLWTVGTLASGAQASLTILVTVTSPNAIVNRATGGSDQFDPVPSNNSAQSVVTPQQADLSVVKSVNTATPNLGDLVTYTVTVNNAGPNVATAPVVYDPVPPGLAFVSATTTAGTYDVDSGLWTLPNLASGGVATLTLVARVIGPGAPLNTARVSAAEFDPNTSNNTATTPLTPNAYFTGSVYDDLNNDGLRGVGEPGIAGVTVQLRNAGNVVVATATTDINGVFVFPGVAPGTYSIVEVQPAGYNDGLDTAGTAGGTVGNDTISAINVAAGARLTGYTFGERTPTPSVTITSASATEGSPVVFPIALSNAVGIPIVLNLTASGGTASSGADYTPTSFEYSVDGGTTWLPGGGVNGTEVTFPAGTTAILARVTTVDDTTDEPNETFNLTGAAVSGTVATVTAGTGTIIDNDPAPTITIGNGSAVEGNQVVFGVSLSNPSSTAIVLDLTATGVTATAGVDFTASTFEYSTDGGITWLPGGGAAGTQVTVPATSTGIQVRVSTIQDTTDEPDETFTLGGTAISGSVTAVNSGTGTIIDNDPAPTITIGNGSAVEGNQVVFGVSLSNPSSSSIVLDLTATGVTATAGVDFTANTFEYSTDGGMTWLPGGGAAGTQVTVPATSTGIQVRVSTIQDTTDEPDETFTLGGTAISGSVTAVNSGIGTIIDNDPAPTVTIGNGSAVEGNQVVFGVSLSNPSSTAIVLDLTATGVSATAGVDFAANNFEYSTDGGITWLPGGGAAGTQVTVPATSTGIQVRVSTIQDTTDEPDETFTLGGTAISGSVTAVNSGTGTIIDNDPAPTITIGNGSAVEGNQVVFGVSLSNPSSTAIVLDLTASGVSATAGVDFIANTFEYSTDGGTTWLPGGGAAGTQVTVPATSTGIQVRVSTVQDTTDEPDETFTLGGTAISGSVTAVNSGTGTIIDNDPAPTITIGNGAVIEGNQVVFGVSLSNPSSTAIVLDLTATGVSATAGVDFIASTFEYSTDGGMTWLPGGGAAGTQVTVPATSTGIEVRVSTIQDTTDEPDETFTLSGTA